MSVMRITDISIDPVVTMPGAKTLRIEIGGFQFTGVFDDFGGFLTAVQEAGVFFAYRAGKIQQSEAQRHMTRLVKPGVDGGRVIETGRG